MAEPEPAAATIWECSTAEPVPFITTRWQCPFCRRARSTRKAAAEHITRCWRNPAVRSCKTCAYFFMCELPDVPHEDCGEGVDISGGLKTGCPLWRAPGRWAS